MLNNLFDTTTPLPVTPVLFNVMNGLGDMIIVMSLVGFAYLGYLLIRKAF